METSDNHPSSDKSEGGALDRLAAALTRMVEAYAALLKLEVTQGVSRAIGVTVFGIVAAMLISFSFFTINITVAVVIGDLLRGQYWVGFLAVTIFYLIATAILLRRMRKMIRMIAQKAALLMEQDDEPLLKNQDNANE